MRKRPPTQNAKRRKKSIPLVWRARPKIADMVNSIDAGPNDLTARKKHHLKTRGYSRKRP
jgi:hypothetical protein